MRIVRIPAIQLVARRQLEHFARFSLDLRQSAGNSVSQSAARPHVHGIFRTFERGDLRRADLRGDNSGFLKIVDDAAAHDNRVEPGDSSDLLCAVGGEQVIDFSCWHALGAWPSSRVAVARVAGLDVIGNGSQGGINLDTLTNHVPVVQARIQPFIKAV